jgi:putative oxidoreductase
MITAIRKVHAPRGPWVTDGGYEYNLVLLAVVFALTDAGPGRLSVDALRGRERWGLRWALAELGAAAVGSALAIELGRRAGRPEPARSEAATPAPAEERHRPEGGEVVDFAPTGERLA